jgi:hypothetical protein
MNLRGFLVAGVMWVSWTALALGQTVPTGAQAPTSSLSQSPLGVENTAAKFKAEEANVAARCAAVRYLGTLDYHYYPEAEDALVYHLRTDRNEGVRYEAALTLGKSCCFSNNTLAALLIAVQGNDADGNPSETSDRVKAVAMQALQHFTCLLATVPDFQKQPETSPGPTAQAEAGNQSASGVQPAGYYSQQVPRQLTSDLFDQACRVIAQSVSTSPAARTLPTGQPNVAGIAVTPAVPIGVDDVAAFDEAVMSLPELRPVRLGQAPGLAAPVQGAPPLRPVTLIAPGTLLNSAR